MNIDETSYKYTIPNNFVIPRRNYHKLYVRRSKIKHMLFALGTVIVLIGIGLFLK